MVVLIEFHEYAIPPTRNDIDPAHVDAQAFDYKVADIREAQPSELGLRSKIRQSYL
ncbi:hypothetical protein [Agrobacterium tumefaciens]|uniref:hypothetical protein n=1 Tax=Agrobacterium tumefaciens TaxID=358 RepID=UPI002789CA05|nr:hypothetical protein [Agrobacterium tumefaciens]MDP9857403.1 hypothetical protein [Agrobacterium tumefaciens]